MLLLRGSGNWCKRIIPLPVVQLNWPRCFRQFSCELTALRPPTIPRPNQATFHTQPWETNMSANQNAEAPRPSAQLKVPKGTTDYFGRDVILRDRVLQIITDIFKRHGSSPLDTPIFELKEVLTGKYGEDARLIYDLQDQGGESCALRYDLTVPLARWAAMNNITQVKRYHIGKVYRRDQPAVARGRLREFDQADFDIVGAYDQMIADSEVLRVVVEVFKALELDITIKVNHRQILDGLFAVAGVPEEKTRAISSAVDKLDKISWAECKKEMVEEKGLPSEVADKIGEYVQHSGNIADMVRFIKSDSALCANQSLKAGLDDMELLTSYLEAFNIADKISFDLSLARGLDYYTGLIYEILYRPSTETSASKGGASSKKNDPATQVGSIGAGGRYDKLIGMYGKRSAPCVGISFGVSRILTILKALRQKEPRTQTHPVDVYIMAFGGGSDFDGLLLERMKVAAQLWDNGISTEFAAKVKPKLPQQFKAAEEVPLAVILGVDELASNQVRIKTLGLPNGHPEKDGVLVDKSTLVAEVQKRLSDLKVTGDAGL